MACFKGLKIIQYLTHTKNLSELHFFPFHLDIFAVLFTFPLSSPHIQNAMLYESFSAGDVHNCTKSNKHIGPHNPGNIHLNELKIGRLATCTENGAISVPPYISFIVWVLYKETDRQSIEKQRSLVHKNRKDSTCFKDRWKFWSYSIQ